MGGALEGVKVVEIGGLGPAPFCAMMLADHGADVLRVERPGAERPPGTNTIAGLAAWDLSSRGRLSAGIDLKHPEGAALVRRLAGEADVFIEGFRPGVAERLGIGPEPLCADNQRLVYGRMTGYGQTGPRARQVGHDINYISLAGVQAHIGRAGSPPTPPLNLVGDYGGGGMFLAFGILAALVERESSGVGQVVEAAMVEGAALLMAPLFGAASTGYWSDQRGTNLLDSGAPFYDCYECSDGKFISVGAIEPAFFAELLAGLGIDPADLGDQNDRSRWPDMRSRFLDVIRSKSQTEWDQIFAERDACVAPVLTMMEAPHDPHLVATGSFVEIEGVQQPRPTPRFSRSDPGLPSPAQVAGANTREVLQQWGLSNDELEQLESVGAVR
ncbi:MAG TPA: carnitine dehydratase [Acidimicrobiaceae bacterium]|jgi:alpha-methylacyl-CoA racemase|nr:carnitine dehydratase [Acidimicrobiaceae bacterium]